MISGGRKENWACEMVMSKTRSHQLVTEGDSSLMVSFGLHILFLFVVVYLFVLRAVFKAASHWITLAVLALTV